MKKSDLPQGIAKCPLCGERVEIHHPDTWKEVKGWVGGPRKDSMRLREDTGEYAHDKCVARLQDGQAVDQPELFGPPVTIGERWEETMNEMSKDSEALEDILGD